MFRHVLVPAAIAAAVAVSWQLGGSVDSIPPLVVSQAMQRKLAHLDEVVRVLGARSTVGLTAAQRAERGRVLDALADYRAARHFPKNLDDPDRAVPYFVDGEGTRCAMAYVFERTGASQLTTRLALEDNHAYLGAYADDAEFGAWLDAHGMSLEEVCYVQGPGNWDDGTDGTGVIMDGGPGVVPTPWDLDAPNDKAKPAAPKPATARGVTGLPNVARGGMSAVGATRSGGLMSRKHGKVAELTVPDWWRRNRGQFLDVRDRYRRAFASTPDAAATKHTPTATLIESDVVPVLEQLATERGEVGATAIVALARATQQERGSPAVPAALRTIGATDTRYPEFAALALGVSRDRAARVPLRLVLSQDEAGARMLAETDQVPSRVAAYAALALGQVGEAQDARWLAKLAADSSRSLEVRSLALLGVARLIEEGDPRDGALAPLAQLLADESMPETVRALVPQALVKSRDPRAIGEVVKFLAEFRKPLAVRRAAALALGEVEAVDGELTRRLLASSERDPDALTRAYAALSLGRLGASAPADDPAAPHAAELAAYHRDGVRGQLTQHGDRPWRMIAAALHARHAPDALPIVTAELVDVLTHENEAELRGASALALGIAGARDAGGALLARLAAERNPQARGLTAEALGMLAEQRASAPLADLLAHADSDLVRYHAAIGLALLADGQTVDVLLAAFESTSSDGVRAMLARAIGELGDATAIDRLARLALDAGSTERSRARAVAALGMVAETAATPWVRSVQRGVDGSSADPIVKEVLSLF